MMKKIKTAAFSLIFVISSIIPAFADEVAMEEEPAEPLLFYLLIGGAALLVALIIRKAISKLLVAIFSRKKE